MINRKSWLPQPLQDVLLRILQALGLLPPPPPVWSCSGIGADFETYDPNPPGPYPVPLITQGITFTNDPPKTRIEERKRSYPLGGVQQSFVALHCGYLLTIELPQDFHFVDLMYCEGGGDIDGFDDQSNLVLHLKVPNTSTPVVVNLVPKGPMRRIEIKSSNEMFLLKICCHN
jgi:hypothetical protein